jgi:hypothetical protein
MRLRVIALFTIAIATTGVGSMAAAAQTSKAKGRSHHASRKVRRHARPSVKKPKPEVWTLSELKNGKQHKLKAGTPFYGKIDGLVAPIEDREGRYGPYEWGHALYCQDAGVNGKVKSNGVATPEIILEEPTGELSDEPCIEEGRVHNLYYEEGTFEYWGKASVHVGHFPWTVTLEEQFEQAKASVSSASYFEAEVEGYYSNTEHTVCKYFYIPELKNQPVSPENPHETSRLYLGITARLSPENYAAACPNSFAGMTLNVAAYDGEDGAPIYATIE